MPAEAPALVHTPPSSKKSTSGSTSIRGWRAASAPAPSQWVVARRPSSTPAAASTNAPEQMLATRAPAVTAARRAAPTPSGSGRNGSCTPGTKTVSASDTAPRPWSSTTSKPVARTRGIGPQTRTR